MTTIDFETLKKTKNDGLVFYGLTDELEEFKTVINDELNNKGLGTGKFEDKFEGIYELNVPDGRRDIVFIFNDKPSIDMGKLAIWRIKLNGLASWISDYVVNRASDFEMCWFDTKFPSMTWINHSHEWLIPV